MNAKLMIAICCVAVLGASTMAGAHLTNPTGSATANALTGDPFRYTDTTPSANSGVSGTYVTGGAAVASDLFPLTVNPLAVVCPAGYCASGNALCDMEVLGSGDGGPTEVLNEQKVDNTPTAGLVPDGTFDDGGIEAACHTRTGNYLVAGYNDHSTDCTGTAHAEDAASQWHVWISPSCDSASQVASPGLATCFVNGVLAANVNTLVGCVTGPGGLVHSVQCAVPNACTAGAGGFLACGADGVADSANLGEGGGDRDESATGATLPFSNDPDGSEGGVPYPGVDPHCTVGDGVGATFVFNGVELNAGLNEDPAGAEYALATAGWIDWTSTASGESFAPEGGVTVDLCALAPLPSPPC